MLTGIITNNPARMSSYEIVGGAGILARALWSECTAEQSGSTHSVGVNTSILIHSVGREQAASYCNFTAVAILTNDGATQRKH